MVRQTFASFARLGPEWADGTDHHLMRCWVADARPAVAFGALLLNTPAAVVMFLQERPTLGGMCPFPDPISVL